LSAGIELRRVEFQQARKELLAVRVPVFVTEQGVPPELEEDERDPFCEHLLATLEGRPVAAARIDLAADGKIGRVAVLREYRGRGIGRDMMLVLHDLAAAAGLKGVWCNAQLSAAPFYEQLGYARCSDEFVEAGIRHVKLQRALQ
jgi:predicted GNAT family N-acyltransferase